MNKVPGEKEEEFKRCGSAVHSGCVVCRRRQEVAEAKKVELLCGSDADGSCEASAGFCGDKTKGGLGHSRRNRGR